MSNVFVYVEGKDDQRFLENILSNYENLSADIIVIPYQQKNKQKDS